MCYPDGGVVDDLLVMCMDTNKYLLIVNGANTDKDVEWIEPLPGISMEQLLRTSLMA